MSRRRGGLVVVATALVLAGCGAAKIVTLECNDHFATWAPGPEDIELDRDAAGGPRLIVSVQERRVHNRDGSFHYQGQILSVPLTGPQRGQARAFTVERDPKTGFHPHGIYLLRTSAQPLLYVINHESAENHRIEIFTVDGDHLRPNSSRASPPRSDYLPNPNDLVALPNGEIYVTNLTRYRSRAAQILEALLHLRSGSVVHYRPDANEAERWRVAVPDLAYPNGIAITGERDRVFVAATRDSRLHIFTRDLRSGALAHEGSIEVGKGVDNLSWDDTGKTLIAARHPEALAVIWHAYKPDAHSPSEILRIDVAGKGIDTVYGNAGDEISAASVGIAFEGRLYIGQVFNQGILGCRERARQ